MPYKFLSNIAIADLAFEATGKSLGELFTTAARAVSESMVNSKTVAKKVKRTLKLENKEIDKLLFELLEEIVFLKDSEQLVFKTTKAKVNQNKKTNSYELQATLEGEKINPERHELHNDIKAITYHMFYVKKTLKGWKARVVVDV